MAMLTPGYTRPTTTPRPPGSPGAAAPGGYRPPGAAAPTMAAPGGRPARTPQQTFSGLSPQGQAYVQARSAPRPNGLAFFAGLPNVAGSPAPNGDPQYLAFLRGLGLQQSQANQRAVQNLGTVGNQFDLAQQDAAATNPIAQRNLNNAYEARGVYSSGQHGVALGDLLAAQTRQGADLTNQRNAAVLGIHQNLQDALSNLAAQRAQQELALQVRMASNNLANIGPFGV